jgi:RHS repeat-associated protein
MKRQSLFLCIMLLATVTATAFAQTPSTGFPPYGSFENGRFDTVNRQNLNVNISIPIVSSPGRGLNLNSFLAYNSIVWMKSGGAWVPIAEGSPVSLLGWKRTSPTGTISSSWSVWEEWYDGYPVCSEAQYFNFDYQDPAGTHHPFPLAYTDGGCGGATGPTAAYASDGSGYYLDSAAMVVWSPDGTRINSKVTDTNGNFISASYSYVGSATETDWTDSSGRAALKVIADLPNTQYKFLDPSGNYVTTTLNYQAFNIKTNFGCSGVVEYTGTLYLVTSIQLPNGRSYQFSYEPTPGYSGYLTGRVQQVTLPTGGTYQYQYGSTNGGISCSDGTVTDLTRTINDGTISAQWHFVRAQSGSNWTTTETAPQLSYDTAPNQTVYTFTGVQEVSRQVYQGSAGGTLLRTINTTWSGGTPATQVVILENGQQSETDTSYDGLGNLLSLAEHAWGSGVPGSVVRTTTLTYLNTSAYTARNIMNRVTRKTISDSNGTVQYRQDIDYDGTSLTSVTGAAQHDDTNYGYTFTTRGNPTSVTTYTDPVTPGGGITKNFYYDSLGNLLQADVNCCQQESWNYALTTQYAYPASVTRGTGGSQLTTNYAYNSYTGLLASVTDENGQTTSYTYNDAMRRLTRITRPDAANIDYSYDDTNRIVTTTSPLQGTSTTKQFAYFDGLGRPVKTKSADGSGTSYSIVETQYDPVGRGYKVSNPHNSSAQYWTEADFDALGRVTKTILPGGQQTTNSYSGSQVTATDPTGKARRTDSDALGRLVTVYEPDVANNNALTQTTSYTYTVLDALAQVNQGVQTRTYNYDHLGRLTNQTTPEGGAWQYQYNSFGLVTQRTDARGVIATYGYDTLNRLSSISYNVGTTGVPATPSVTFTYGTNTAQYNNGRLITITDGLGSEGYTYNNLGQVTQVQKIISGTTYTTSYAYNLAGEATQVTYPSGRQLQPSYDAIGRLSQVASGGTNFTSGYTYNPAFQVTGFNYGNGVTASLGYSADRLQLTSLAYTKNTTTLFSLGYGYTQSGGNNGQITSITDNVDNGRSVTYTYDALYRLKTALTTGSTNFPQWGLSETYDRYGNRTAQTVTAGTGPWNSVTIDANTNRITGTGYGYDASGNMTADGLNALTYDAENRAVTVAGNAYAYDGNGLRVRKCAPNCSSPTSSTVYIFSGSKVIAEYDNGAAPASPTREYVYSGGSLVAKIEGSATKYYHQDHLSNRVITDANGAAIEQHGHFPFGEDSYSGGDKWKFTTYERDPESGNDYAIARTYVNRLGRFNSPDLVAGSPADPQSLNRYAYTRSDPVNLADPNGLTYTPPSFYPASIPPAPVFINTVITGTVYGVAPTSGAPSPSSLSDLGGGAGGGGDLFMLIQEKGGGEPPEIRGPGPGSNVNPSILGPPPQPSPPRPECDPMIIAGFERIWQMVHYGRERYEAGFSVDVGRGGATNVHYAPMTYEPGILRIPINPPGQTTALIAHTHGQYSGVRPSEGDRNSRVPNYVVSRDGVWVTNPRNPTERGDRQVRGPDWGSPCN